MAPATTVASDTDQLHRLMEADLDAQIVGLDCPAPAVVAAQIVDALV